MANRSDALPIASPDEGLAQDWTLSANDLAKAARCRADKRDGFALELCGHVFGLEVIVPHLRSRSLYSSGHTLERTTPTTERRMIDVESSPNPLLARVRRLAGRLGTTSARAGCGRVAVAARLLDVWRRTGIRPGQAMELGLCDPEISEEQLSGCFAKHELVALQNALNPSELTCLTEDKGVFYPLCVALGLPVPRTFALVSRAGGWVAPGHPVGDREGWVRALEEALPARFVTKPSRGVYGDAITAWTRVDGGFADHRGRLHSTSELHEALISHPRHASFVVQERLENHPDIARLTGHPALQTVRATTLVEADGQAALLFAAWKLAIGDNVIDNLRGGATGNLIANVGRDTGLLASARRPSSDGVGWVTVPRHPVTGLALEGAQLPDWRALVELVKRATLLFLPLRTVGWDVGLTPRGPVIVEGNRWWDPASDRALGPSAPGVARHEVVDGAARLRSAAAALRRQEATRPT